MPPSPPMVLVLLLSGSPPPSLILKFWVNCFAWLGFFFIWWGVGRG
uniref:Uncharacterized protein MANES_18G105400 n=1 Tax=Rhizophora mucronata TaxID=61149 RepID=A0A2P2N4U6_RHIMU